MKYIATIYQGSEWEGNGIKPFSPGIQAVFEEKSGPPNYGTHQGPLTEEQCLALLQEPLSPQDLKQIDTGLARISAMKASCANLPREDRQAPASAALRPA